MDKPHPNCNDIFEPGLISLNQALAKILNQVHVLNGHEWVNIDQAKGRTLCQDITAPFNVPAQNNSAVDGYALNATEQENGSFKLVGKSLAGQPYQKQLKNGEAISITTGAQVPVEADRILMQETVRTDAEHIYPLSKHSTGQNIRLAGEDIKQNSVVLSTGRYLTAADIGLIASMGIGEVKVKRRLNIAIASTGNEIMAIGQEKNEAQLFDSNRYTLSSALNRPDITLTQLGIIDDDPEKLKEQFSNAAQSADIIISSGGVSVGEADYTKAAIESNGQVEFWKIAIKPGRPLAFGKIEDCLFFGLPGNPVAVMVTYFLFVIPAIEAMLAMDNPLKSPCFQAICTENIRKKPGRTEIVRARLYYNDQDQLRVKTTGSQGSGILTSMSQADAFIILEQDRSSVKAGEWVKVQSLAGIF